MAIRSLWYRQRNVLCGLGLCVPVEAQVVTEKPSVQHQRPCTKKEMMGLGPRAQRMKAVNNLRSEPIELLCNEFSKINRHSTSRG